MAIEVIPGELRAAVRPLETAGTALRGLGDARRQVSDLLDEVPNAELREAFEHYVASWSHVALDLGDQAEELGKALGYAARYYDERERALARGFRYDRRLP